MLLGGYHETPGLSPHPTDPPAGRDVVAGQPILYIPAAGRRHPTSLPGCQSQHRGGQFSRKPVVSRVRGSAHAIVEDTIWWWGGEIEGSSVQEPFGPWQAAVVESLGERG